MRSRDGSDDMEVADENDSFEEPPNIRKNTFICKVNQSKCESRYENISPSSSLSSALPPLASPANFYPPPRDMK
jgi:hypothetical protein